VKNALRVLVVVLITVAFSGISFAQAKPATPATPATPPAPAMEKKTESEKAKTTRITGEVTSVDSKAGTVTVKTKDKETNLIADSNAKGALGKVKVGDMVKVTYTEKEGKMLASSIAGVKSKAKKSEKATAK
jgi:ribosomal protein S1